MLTYKKRKKNSSDEINIETKRKLRGNPKRREIDIEEIFLDKFIRRKKEDEALRERKLEVPLKKKNFLILFFFGVILMGMLAFFALKLQLRAEEHELLARENKFVFSRLKSERGVIYDRNMEQLVWNEAIFDIVVTPSELPEGGERERVFEELSEIVAEDVEILKQGFATSVGDSSEDFKNQPIVLVKNPPHQALILFETKKEGLPGFELRKRILRHYHAEAGTAHLLGYLGKISPSQLQDLEGYELDDYIGKEGLERIYEDVLKEKGGIMRIGRSAKGEIISKEIKEYPRSGDSIVLSLDFALQKKIAEALKAVLKEIGSQKAAAVAIDPRNGEILASVSLPFFDNNLFAQGISPEELKALNEDPLNPQLNRVIGGLYPTGSTIKPLISVAALEEGVVTLATSLYCPLELCLVNQYTGEGECFADWTFHGWTDVKKAIAESVNPFFYMIGGGYKAPPQTSEFFNPNLPKNFEGLGVTKISNYLRLFGLGEKTGIDLPGEVEGRVPDPSWKEAYFANRPRAQQIWYRGDTYNLSIGQGYLLTSPIQMATAFAAIANGGKIFKPKLVKAVVEEESNQETELSPQLIKEDFVKKESLKIVRQGMRQAVNSPSGSAIILNSLPVSAAAKTGTAQIYPNREIYHNWVAVFAPFTEIPSDIPSGSITTKETSEIVLLVLIEEVEGTRLAALKVAREVLQWYFAPEDETTSEEETTTTEDAATTSEDNSR